MAKKEKPSISITLIRSPLGRLPRQRATIKALGLGKMNSHVIKVPNDAILGMIESVSHLLKVEEL